MEDIDEKEDIPLVRYKLYKKDPSTFEDKVCRDHRKYRTFKKRFSDKYRNLCVMYIAKLTVI